jgi:hypothetical protein
MKLGRLLVLLSLFVMVGGIANATIDSFGPVPDCHKFPNQPRCN